MKRKHKSKYNAAIFLEAIPGSGGIINNIARRVGCDWHTAERWIENHPTLKRAFEDEREKMVDMCEFLILENIRRQAASQVQNEGMIADTGDAKWVLARLGKDRGWVERQETTGKDGEDLIPKNVIRITNNVDRK